MKDEYDAWLRKEVQQALGEVDDPKADWISSGTVKADVAAQREALQRRIGHAGNDILRS
ncbi:MULTISPECIES: hypothetical protein [Burkholderia]|uniref:hypothetical protein n=1 Tax=Burkholderia TaxID=32008 RepID=UPI000AA86391|nr:MULTISPECIES: hypothetical protein [Burkholderia]